MRISALLLMIACEGDKYVDTGKLGFDDELPDDDDTGPSTDSDTSPGETSDTSASGETAETGDTIDNTYEPVDCDGEMPALPTDYLYINLGSSEDFAFDAEGWVWHVDERGNLVKDNYAGDREIIRPSVGSAAGTRFLPGGDLVVADVSTGSVKRITPEGGVSTIMSGISYPNGLEVGKDGLVYVSDQTQGKVLQIDPETGDHRAIAENLYSPNGVTFSPDQNTLYVGSFGGGVVWRIDRLGDDWADPELWAGLEGSFAFHAPPCDGLAEGDLCFQSGQGGPGTCVTDADCVHEVDTAACVGLSEGDACTTELLDTSFLSQCVADEEGALFCPAVDAARMDDCDTLYGTCVLDGEDGYCNLSFEDVLVCITYTEYTDFYFTCDGLVEGDDCVTSDPAVPTEGSCVDYTEYGYDEMYCVPGNYYVSPEGGGGFDAIGTDECGNVYIGEYVTAKVYRWQDGGEDPEVVIDLDSSWIPNMHWGVGVGGWESDYLWIMDRGRGGLYGLDMNLLGHGEAYPPEE